MIMGLGLVAFILDSMVGVIFVKILNIFTPKNKINPMVGAAGISAFPMSSRVIEKLGQEADSQNHLLMHAVAANVSGQIASVVAGGVVLQYFANNPILWRTFEHGKYYACFGNDGAGNAGHLCGPGRHRSAGGADAAHRPQGKEKITAFL